MGGKTATSTQQVSIPPQVLAQYQSVNAQAAQTAQTPFQTYGGEFVAPVNPQQQTGIAGVNAGANVAQPYYGQATSDINQTQANTTPVNNAATGLAAASAEQVNPNAITGSDINQYLSPYLGDVLGSTSALINQNNQQAQAGQLGTAITSGAFGGDRTGLAAANLQQQEDLAAGNVYSNIANTGFQTALGTAQQQQGVGLAAGQANRAALANAGSELSGIGATQYGEGANTATTLAGLGTGAQTAALTGAQAQLGAGTVEQQTQQAQDTALYNQFLQQQSYPFQVDQFLANIAEGTGALSGSTTTTQQPGGFFSDKRLKYDMRKIGKTYDGQAIYSYKMHGDPRTHVGLIAQEVEKKHPHAVGLASGYRFVDYGKATEKAANRGHFADGGGISAGGRVWRPAAYAVGGSPSIVSQSDLQAILAAQSGMYAPMSGGAGFYGGSSTGVPRGGSSRVPAPTGATPHLVTASGGLKAQPSALENAKGMTDLGTSAAKLYASYKKDHPPQDVPPPSSDAPTPAATPGDTTPTGLASGGRAGYEDGGNVVDINSILDAQRQMYQPQHSNRDIPQSSNGHQLAVASGSPTPPPSGANNVNQAIGLGQKGYQVYHHFNQPTTNTGPTASQAAVEGPPAPAADTSGLGAADTSAAAAPAAAPAAADVGAGAGAADAAGTAAGAAGSTAAGAAVDAGAEEAAALAAEYAAADAAVAVAAARRGGAIRGKFDAGGTPYADTGGQIDIPDTQNTEHLQTAGPIKKQPTGLQTAMTMGNPNDVGGIVGGMFSNQALARGGIAAQRRGYADGGSPDDLDADPNADPDAAMVNPQGVARGVINRNPKKADLMYSRDAGSPIPYVAPKAPAPQPTADTGSSFTNYLNDAYGSYGDEFGGVAAPPPTHGASGTWGIPSANAAPAPMAKRPASKAVPEALGAATATDQGPPTNLQGDRPTYTGGVNAIPVSTPDPQTPAQVPVEKQSWWDKIKGSELAKPENLIPLLTAIGAMGTAPTRSLGVAAAAGLEAGAGSYLPTQQALADIKQTGATTALTGAETGGQNVRNIAELQQQYALRGLALFPDPNGPITGPDGKRYVAKPKAAAMAPSQASGAPPQYTYLGKNGVDTAKGEGVRYSMLPDESQNASQKQIDDIYQSGHASQQNMLNIQRWEQSMAANKGVLDGGAMNDLRVKAANLWDTMMDTAGHPEYKVSGLPEAQIAAKVSTGAAAMNENEHQQRSFGALKAFLAATPNPEMQKQAALPLIADLHTENQMSIDRKNYLDEFDKENQRSFGAPVPRNYLAADALQSFDKDYPSNNYQGERNNLATIMQSQGFYKLSADLQNSSPEKKQKLYQALDAKYGPNFHRYFTGS